MLLRASMEYLLGRYMAMAMDETASYRGSAGATKLSEVLQVLLADRHRVVTFIIRDRNLRPGQ